MSAGKGRLTVKKGFGTDPIPGSHRSIKKTIATRKTNTKQTFIYILIIDHFICSCIKVLWTVYKGIVDCLYPSITKWI